jgi:hypothetical protein
VFVPDYLANAGGVIDSIKKPSTTSPPRCWLRSRPSAPLPTTPCAAPPRPESKGHRLPDFERTREVGATPAAHLLVHCCAGVSRSAAAAALILMQANPEWPASAALDMVAAIRPRAWPNLLILELGDALLGRNGEIVAAAGPIYRRALARDPDFVDQMIDARRIERPPLIQGVSIKLVPNKGAETSAR